MNRRPNPSAAFRTSRIPALTPAFLASSALFCSSRQMPPFVFINLRTLCALDARRKRRNPFPSLRFRTLAKTIGGGGGGSISYPGRSYEVRRLDAAFSERSRRGPSRQSLSLRISPRPFFRKSFTFCTSEKSLCNSFGFCTSEIIGLKVPQNQHFQKYPGERG